MPCASIYSILRGTTEVPRMFQSNLENTLISFREIIDENNIFRIIMHGNGTGSTHVTEGHGFK